MSNRIGMTMPSTRIVDSHQDFGAPTPPQRQDRLNEAIDVLNSLTLEHRVIVEMLRRALKFTEEEMELHAIQIRRDLTQPKPDPRYVTVDQLSNVIQEVLTKAGFTAPAAATAPATAPQPPAGDIPPYDEDDADEDTE